MVASSLIKVSVFFALVFFFFFALELPLALTRDF